MSSVNNRANILCTCVTTGMTPPDSLFKTPLISLPGTAIINEELCTVGNDHAVITWVTPQGTADSTIHIGEEPTRLNKNTFISNTEFHMVEVSNLRPSTRYWYRVESNGVKGPLNSFTTLPKPEGKYLFSYALFSDIHISCGDSRRDINEIYFGKLVEYSVSLLMQCILDSKRRNIDLAVITGDLTDSASQVQYSLWHDYLLPCFGEIPCLPCIGNHDKYLKDSGLSEQGFLNYLAKREKTYTSITFRDYNFLLLDSCKQDDNWGYIAPEQMQWIEDMLEKSRGRPSFLFLHHPCNGIDVWFGLKNYREFQRIIRQFPDVQAVFSGHIHRNKVTTNRLKTGNLPYVEVPATVQFPCSYAVVRVYENGFEYNSYKVSRLDWSEMSRERVILKNGGKALFTWYSLAGIGDRSFSYFNGRLERPRQYELSVTVDRKRAMELYDRAQSLDGASLAHAARTGKVKVILGRHESLYLATQSLRQKFSRYGMQVRVIKEGNYDIPQEIKYLYF